LVRDVRSAEPTTSEPHEKKPAEKLQGSVHRAIRMPAVAMDLPYADRVIRLDFAAADFERTAPGGLP
jgi:hypothetical protein